MITWEGRTMTATGDQHLAFLRAIQEEPDDDAIRLIYADWLLERDDPRGEFIRLQVEEADPCTPLEVAATAGSRARDLLAQHWEEWVSPLREALGPNTEPWIQRTSNHPEGIRQFRRGFVEGFTLGMDTIIERIDALRQVTPVRHLFITRLGTDFGKFANHPALEELESLHFRANFRDPLGDDEARLLGQSERLLRLTELSLYQSYLTDVGLSDLGQAKWFSRLINLNLAQSSISGDGIGVFSGPNAPTELRVLRLGGTTLRDDGLVSLLESPVQSSLRVLDLRGCFLTASSCTHLSRSSGLGQLTSLSLSSNNFGQVGINELLRARFLPRLLVLDLSGCGLEDGGVQSLCRSGALRNLHSLSLANNRISDVGARALARSPNFPRLSGLNLEGNHLTHWGHFVLERSPLSTHVKELSRAVGLG